MNPWKLISLGLGIVALALVVAMIASSLKLKQYEHVIDDYAAGELTRQGFTPGRYVKPDIPHPPGAQPILRAKGTVQYVPVPVRFNPVSVTKGTDPKADPCDLSRLSVDIDCQADALATPSKPWAKLLVSGKISGFGQERVLPETVAGQVHLDVNPAVKQKPLPWEVRVGVGAPYTARLGATYMPWRRVGFWADLAVPLQGDGAAAGIGVAFRF